jgi:pimeloyl-ACP methyl ester carboxylesterase
MRRRRFLTLAAIAATLLALPAFAEGDTKMPALKTGFAPINGLQMYYEIRGEGAPLLMLHGGIGASEQFGLNLAELAKTRQVIITHLQGHGFTRDIDRPYDFMQMSDDVAALLDHLKIGKTDVLGYSLGGGVTQQLALRHPEKIRALVLVCATAARDGSYPEVVAAFKGMAQAAPQIAMGVRQSPMGAMYPDVDWENAFKKTGALTSAAYDWSTELEQIKVPVLLIYADADSVMPDHMVKLYQAFGGFKRDASFDGSLRPVSQLAILPGRTHYNIMETTDVARLAEAFLAKL